MILLSFINEKSLEFDRELKENKNKRTKEDFYIKCFKYPYATYLTAELFESLISLIDYFSKLLVQQTKTEAKMMEQYSFKYLLNIFYQNVQALTYTHINLLDLLDKNGY